MFFTLNVNCWSPTICEQTGWGVAMGNGVRATKECAQEVARSNEEDGVARVLEEVVRRGRSPRSAGSDREAKAAASSSSSSSWRSELAVVAVVAVAHGLDLVAAWSSKL